MWHANQLRVIKNNQLGNATSVSCQLPLDPVNSGTKSVNIKFYGDQKSKKNFSRPK